MTLEKLNRNAFEQFKDQLNIYNKFYSNYIVDEPPLENYQESMQHADLNLGEKRPLVFRDG